MIYFRRIRRSFAMYRFAAALPFTMRAGLAARLVRFAAARRRFGAARLVVRFAVDLRRRFLVRVGRAPIN